MTENRDSSADSRPTSPDNVPAPTSRYDVDLEKGRGFLTVPDMRSRNNSLESVCTMRSMESRLRAGKSPRPYREGDPHVEDGHLNAPAYYNERNGILILDQNRDVARKQILEYLRDNIMQDGASPDTSIPQLSDLDARLLQVVDAYHSDGRLAVNRFERLSILNVLQAQHRLVKLDEEIKYKRRGFPDRDQDELQWNLSTYVQALEIHCQLSTFRQPGLEVSRGTGVSLALQLEEPHYWDSADALNLCDLTPNQIRAPWAEQLSTDRLRTFLQRWVPEAWLDKDGKERREIDIVASQNESRAFDSKFRGIEAAMPGAGSREIARAYSKRPYHISPAVDIVARLVVALLGGIMILVPMTVLCYVTAFKWVLMTTFLCTILFSIAVSVVSRASNDQIMAATAAYGAVLVVFVANIIPRTTVP